VSIHPLTAEPRRPVWLERRNAGLVALRHGLSEHALAQLDQIIAAPQRLEKNRVLYRAGAPAVALFIVQSGTFKTVSYLQSGRSQITGLHIAGDILGLPGIAEGAHAEDGISLEFSQVAPVPLDSLARLATGIPALQHNIARVLGAAIARSKRALLLLGHRTAEERVAFFFVDQSRRLRQAGYSAIEFQLPVSNNDLANLAGMTSETVSRLLRAMQVRGLIERRHRLVRLTDLPALEELAGISSE
jgi:CRP/FNR family transcriptional regulator